MLIPKQKTISAAEPAVRQIRTAVLYFKLRTNLIDPTHTRQGLFFCSLVGIVALECYLVQYTIFQFVANASHKHSGAIQHTAFD